MKRKSSHRGSRRLLSKSEQSTGWNGPPTIESWAMVTPGDVLRSLRRRIPSILFTTGIVTLAIMSLLIVWPNQYRSEGMMYVRLGRAATGADPMAKTSNSVSMQESRTAEVVSIGEMIGSREIAERAVKRVGVEVINQPRNWIEQASENFSAFLKSDSKWVSWLARGEPETVGDMTAQQVESQIQREEAIQSVAEAIDVEVAKNGYTVAVAGKEDDPLLIQSIVQAVMDEFGSYHVEAHRVKGSEPFFDTQTSESRELAIAARKKLQETRNQMGWISTESAERTLSERIIDLERKLSSADSELAEAISQAEELRRQLDTTEQWVPIEITLGIANAAGDQMRSQLYDVQVQGGEELARLSPSHPRYKRIKEKLDKSEDLASSEREERRETKEAINPVYQELETQFQSVRAQAVGLASRRDAIDERLTATESDLKRLNDDITTMSQLTWEAELAEETFRGHARSLEKARINAELDEQQMSDVSVIQPATLNLKKSGPARGLLSIVGAMLGLSLGLLQAILRDSPVDSHSHRRSGVDKRDLAPHFPEDEGKLSAVERGVFPSGEKVTPDPESELNTQPESSPDSEVSLSDSSGGNAVGLPR